jgi:hypothetical protein
MSICITLTGSARKLPTSSGFARGSRKGARETQKPRKQTFRWGISELASIWSRPENE